MPGLLARAPLSEVSRLSDRIVVCLHPRAIDFAHIRKADSNRWRRTRKDDSSKGRPLLQGYLRHGPTWADGDEHRYRRMTVGPEAPSEGEMSAGRRGESGGDTAQKHRHTPPSPQPPP